MHILKIVLPLVASAWAAGLPRSASQILADLKQTDSDVNKATAACTSWDGTLANSGTISSTESTVESDLKRLTTDCQSSAVMSAADATSIANYFNNTLEPDLRRYLACVQNRKAAFKAAGLQSTVLMDIKNVKAELDQACAACVAQTATPQQGSLKQACTKCDNDLNAAISYYSS